MRDPLGQETTLAYDDLGRLTDATYPQRGVQHVDSAEGGERTLYRYTALDQLTEVLHGAPGAEVSRGQYEYDATGRRVRQRGTTRGDVETVYDGLSAVDEHTMTGGAAAPPLAHYHYAQGLARLDEGAGEERYYHLDGRGNTGALTAGSGGADAPGAVLTSYRLDPFGAVRSGTDPVNRQLYTGHETDTETGLIYMNARHYDPETGRFVTQDSWMGTGGDPGTQNRYAYALGNPATYWDPTGHASEPISGGCNSGPEKCGEAAREREGGTPYREDSSHILLGAPPQPAPAPAPETRTARPAPRTPRGTFSVIPGGLNPGELYNAARSYVGQRQQQLQQRHAEINQRIEDQTRVTNWLGRRTDYSAGVGYTGHRGFTQEALTAGPIDDSDVPTMSPRELMEVYASESAPTVLMQGFVSGVELLFAVGDLYMADELGDRVAAKRNYERLSEIMTFLAVLEDSPEVIFEAIRTQPGLFVDRYLDGESEAVGTVVAALYEQLGSAVSTALGGALGMVLLKTGVQVAEEAADGGSALVRTPLRGGEAPRAPDVGDGPPTRRGDQSAFAEEAEEAVAAHTGGERNPLGSGEYISDPTRSRADGTPRRYYLDQRATGPRGSLALHGSVIEVKASGLSGSLSAGLSGRSRRQLRAAIEYAHALRRGGAEHVTVEVFTNLSAPLRGEFADAVADGILVVRAIPR